MEWLKRNRKGLLLVLGTWGIFFLQFWPRIFYEEAGDLVAGYGPVYWDWLGQMAYAKVFQFQELKEWFSHHPLFFPAKYNYPFLANLISGLLMRWGVSDTNAFIYPSIVTTFFLLIALFAFYRLYLSSKASWLAITIFFSCGGWGFISFFKDLFEAPSLSTLFFPPKDYTHILKLGIHRNNFVLAELLPQRGMLLGVPVVLAILTWLKGKIERSENRIWPFVVLGIFASSLMVIHLQCFMVLAILCFPLFIVHPKPLKRWFAFGLATAVPTLALYYSLHMGEQSYTLNRIFYWYPGWLSRDHDINVFYFWWLSWGFFLPIAIGSLFRSSLRKDPLILGGMILFILANLFSFQPNPWDNHKLFAWSYLILTIPVTQFLILLWEKRSLVFRILAILLLVSMTATGFVDLLRNQHTYELAYTMWIADDRELTKNFQKISEPSDRVLCSDHPFHWVTTLSGRRALMGFKGWVGSYGFPYYELDHDMHTMFRGGEKAENLLNSYGIRYVVIGPEELKDFGANEKYFSKKYNLVLNNTKYRVYQRPRPTIN
jgi:hypothetical protein